MRSPGAPLGRPPGPRAPATSDGRPGHEAPPPRTAANTPGPRPPRPRLRPDGINPYYARVARSRALITDSYSCPVARVRPISQVRLLLR